MKRENNDLFMPWEHAYTKTYKFNIESFQADDRKYDATQGIRDHGRMSVCDSIKSGPFENPSSKVVIAGRDGQLSSIRQSQVVSRQRHQAPRPQLPTTSDRKVVSSFNQNSEQKVKMSFLERLERSHVNELARDLKMSQQHHPHEIQS